MKPEKRKKRQKRKEKEAASDLRKRLELRKELEATVIELVSDSWERLKDLEAQGDQGVLFEKPADLAEEKAFLKLAEVALGRLKNCGRHWYTKVCSPCGYVLKKGACVAFGCGRLWCSICSKRRSERNHKRAAAAVRLMSDPRFVTLTMAHKKGQGLKVLLKMLKAAFRRLRQRVVWKRVAGVTSYVFSFEVTVSEANGWHPHIHLIYDGNYVDREEFLTAWRGCGGGKHGLDIRKADEGTVSELAKYMTKPTQMLYAQDGEPFSMERRKELLREFMVATYRFQSFGIGGFTSEQIEEEVERFRLESETEGGKEERCPRCGSTDLVERMVWADELFSRGRPRNRAS